MGHQKHSKKEARDAWSTKCTSAQISEHFAVLPAQRFINANAIINVPNATPVAPVPVVSVANIVLVQDTPVVPVVILVSDSDSGGEEDAMNEIISFLSSDDEIGILLSSDEDDEIGILLSSDDEIEL